MYTLAAISMLAAIAAAAPTPQAASITCAGTSDFPWFINPQTSTSCTAPAILSQPASGPAPGRNTTCLPLNSDDASQTFVAAAINTPCTDEPYAITLYSTSDCTDAGIVAAAGGSCIVAPGAPFVAYSAVSQF